MLQELLSKSQRIAFTSKDIVWDQSIREAAKPLLRDNVVEKKYVQKMIDNVLELGPYIVIAPKIALAHARPEDGVNEIGLSLLVSEKPIEFSNDKQHTANLVFCLAATDSTSHLSLLSDLAQIFGEQSNIDNLCKLKSKEEVLHFISHCLGGVL